MKKFLSSFFLCFLFFGCTHMQKFQMAELPTLIKNEEQQNVKFIFDEARIRKVFYGWDIKEENINGEHSFNMINKKNNVIVDISNYREGDTIQKAARRIHRRLQAEHTMFNDHSAMVIYQDYYYKGVDKTSSKFLGRNSDEFIGRDEWEEKHLHTIFLDNVKIRIQYPQGKKDYKEALKMVREAIDPSVSAEPKTSFVHRAYKVDEMFDVKKIERELKEKTGYIKKGYVESERDPKNFEKYTFVLDNSKNSRVLRTVFIESNEGYSSEVKADRWEFFFKKNPNAKFRGNGKDDISVSYFGVPSMRLKNGLLKSIGAEAMINIIPADDYTIVVWNWIPHGDKKAAEIEYEEILKVIKSSMKKYK